MTHAPTTSTGTDHLAQLRSRIFRHAAFRPGQEAVCRAVVAGQDALIVMPTGAGKSLCYQLPGLARGGSTLIVSPLIALMDDQVSRLQQLGLRAAAVHSGCSPQSLSITFDQYLRGRLDFLFCAPERLKGRVLLELLQRNKPRLVAIDEAHCISQWGHDFRPDYRHLRRALKQLMPVPVVAATATATPRVQSDIVEQLGLRSPARYISGFRREALALEVLRTPRAARAALVADLLDDEQRLPAIVYASTRKEVEELAIELAPLGAGAYHAGLPHDEREWLAKRFLAGELQLLVATSAFGMGIDKPDVRTVVHTSLPPNLEAYYQEVGRAGRDGKPARAVLLHSVDDAKSIGWLLERDHPPTNVVGKVFTLLRVGDGTRQQLIEQSGLDPKLFDTCLQKVLAHADPRESTTPPAWLTRYDELRRGYFDQLDAASNYARASSCRMVALIRHFGSELDSAANCGLCDRCNPDDALTARVGAARDAKHRQLVLRALSESDGRAVGKLFQSTLSGRVSRRKFDALLAEMVRERLLRLDDAEFVREGSTVRFTRASIEERGRALCRAERSTVPGAASAAAKPRYSSFDRVGQRPKRLTLDDTSVPDPGLPSRGTRPERKGDR